MSNGNTTIARRRSDGTLVEVMPDGSTKPLADKTDWQRLRGMANAKVEAAAFGDPDAQPLSDATLARMQRVPRVKTLRRALKLTQQEFARAIRSRSARCATGNRHGRNRISRRAPISRPLPAIPRVCTERCIPPPWGEPVDQCIFF